MIAIVRKSSVKQTFSEGLPSVPDHALSIPKKYRSGERHRCIHQTGKASTNAGEETVEPKSTAYYAKNPPVPQLPP